jgi:dTDP-4-amino-4,6-dideoxygalactose transaminase
MQVPFLDLKTPHQELKTEIFELWNEVYDNTAFANGPMVETFEKQFAQFCKTDYAVGVNSGTDALWAVLVALGIGPGDEVITVPNTFIATVEAIHNVGATPVLVDVKPDTYNMDPQKLEQAITPKTKAVIPVHIFGQMADMPEIQRIAAENNLKVIEDAAQAHGASCHGKHPGAFSDAACFSFYPGKNLGACGEGGAVVTNDTELAQAIIEFRHHGQADKHKHDRFGWNNRMDGLQAAALSVKLKYLPSWNEARRQHAQQYYSLLDNVDNITLPEEKEYNKHVYHVFAIRTSQRDQLMDHLQQNGIGCGIHYPTPAHLQKAFQYLGKKEGDYPVAEQCAREFVSLPMFPNLTEEQIEYTCNHIIQFSQKIAKVA